MSEELKKFFHNAIKTFNITENSYLTNNTTEILNPVNKVIFNYKDRPNILAIKKVLGATTLFLFRQVPLFDI